ncbi:hypothetical protein DH2020_038090 [Rehmannia glutinosa]|uniref:COBRA C-terminal domain-containing protein n=1 Tax=Rehmannia glutinosa TaxID=99300 RepID=A0ABR0V1P7_REHGL
MNNFQMYRHIMSPGWTLTWGWAKKEVIWSMVGAQTTEQGDCSKFKGNVPHCCKRNPTVVDLLPEYLTINRLPIAAKAGRGLMGPRPSSYSFQVGVGLAELPTRRLKLPKNFTLLGPWTGLHLRPCKDRAFDRLLHSGPQKKNSSFKSNSDKLKKLGINTPRKDNVPLLQCTHHMCPIRVHWHVKINYREYWRVKVAITNFNYRMNYTQWTLVAQHPNLNNVTQVFSFDYKPLVPYQSINDTGMFYGMKFYNDLLMEAGPFGNVQTEILLKKDKDTFSLRQGWAFPRKIYFNGDECKLPSPDAYPILPNYSHKNLISFSRIAGLMFLLVVLV